MSVRKINKEGEIDDLIKKVETTWPRYKITKEQLLRPTSDFVIQFYQKFMESIRELAVHIFDDSDGFFNEYVVSCPEEVSLYIHVHYLLSKINVNYISLIDIYVPSSKRVKIAIKLALNCLAYMNGCIHVAKEIIDSNINHVIKNNASYEAELSKTKEAIRKFALICNSNETDLLQTKSDYVEIEKEVENFVTIQKNGEDELSRKRCEVDILEKNSEENNDIIMTLDWEIGVLNQEIVWDNDLSYKVTYNSEMELKIQELDSVRTEYLFTLENKRKDIKYIKLLTSILQESNIDDFDIVNEFDEFQKDSSYETLPDEIQEQKITLANKIKSTDKLSKKVEQLRIHRDATVMQFDELINLFTLDSQKETMFQENMKQKYQNQNKELKFMENKCHDLEEEIQVLKILNKRTANNLITHNCKLQNKIINYFHNLGNEYK